MTNDKQDTPNSETEAIEAEIVSPEKNKEPSKDEEVYNEEEEYKGIRPIGNALMAHEDIDPIQLAKNAEKMAKVELQLRQIALKMTNKNDWVDEGGKPYLQWSGAARVASAFGVSYFDITTEKDKYSDDKGEFIIFECKGKIKWRGRQIEEMGTGSTRDAFFGKRNGEFLPLSEVDIPNVKKKAQTNFLNRGLKSICGLSFTWEEVTAATGLKPEEVGGSVDFSKKKEKNLDDPKRAEIKKWLVEMHGKNASVTLQALTTFKTKDGKTIQGKKKLDECSDAQIKMLHKKVQEQYKEWVSRKK